MGQLKALFGLDRDPVLIVDRPGWDSTAGSNTWTFLESIIDPMADRLEEKHGGCCRLRTGRGIAGYVAPHLVPTKSGIATWATLF